FGSLFIAIGASCTDMRETKSMTWPVMLLICIPMFVWLNVIREPNSSFATGISLFPFATPMLMLGRQAVPPGIPRWQPLSGVCLASPFHGMDPYSEAFGLWADFHTKLIAEIERTLAASVPDGYVIRTPFRSYVMLTPSDPTEKHSMEPDVSIAESEDRRRRRPRRTGTALVEKSPGEAVGMTMGDFISTQEREPYIEIYQTRPKRKLVTGIEILS